MSISSSTRKAGPFACNGSTVAFPFAFKVFTTADVRVVLTDSNSVESDLALGTNYTVTLNADQDANPGGTVTTTATYVTGYKITLTSQVQNLQPVTLTNQGAFYPKVINNALDRLTIMAQQLAEQVGRAVKTSISSSSTPDQLLSDIGTAVTNASNSATAAAGSATNSANSATASANSATASANSATAAANSATQAANSAASLGFTLSDLQTQGKTAATSAGAAPAFTVATNPAYGALAAGQRMRVKFHAAGTTGNNTLNRDGLGAKNLKQYDSSGAKVAAVVAANQLADVEYDGTDMVILNPIPQSVYTVEYLVVAGGGGGGGSVSGGYAGGGGGGGGFVSASSIITGGTSLSVTIGAGGSGGSSSRGVSGGNSTLGSLATAIGGGGGGYTSATGGLSGGSGGGGAFSSGTGGTATSGQGYAGGNANGANGCSAGGGGAGGAASNVTSAEATNGGPGAAWSDGVTYAGGGGGGNYTGTVPSQGGSGGGGNGGLGLGTGGPTAGSNGTANRGGGGGGGGTNNSVTLNGGSGGSGVVIVRYAGAQRGTGGTVTSAGGYTYHTFTSSGTFTT